MCAGLSPNPMAAPPTGTGTSPARCTSTSTPNCPTIPSPGGSPPVAVGGGTAGQCPPLGADRRRSGGGLRRLERAGRGPGMVVAAGRRCRQCAVARRRLVCLARLGHPETGAPTGSGNHRHREIWPARPVSTPIASPRRHSEDRLVLDARAAAAYRGDEEPLDQRAGHIPGAVRHPTAENLNADGTFLPAAELRARFQRWAPTPARSRCTAAPGSPPRIRSRRWPSPATTRRLSGLMVGVVQRTGSPGRDRTRTGLGGACSSPPAGRGRPDVGPRRPVSTLSEAPRRGLPGHCLPASSVNAGPQTQRSRTSFEFVTFMPAVRGTAHCGRRGT